MAALGTREVALAEAPRDADRRVLNVDVAPAQRDELAAPEPCEGGRQEDRGVLRRSTPARMPTNCGTRVSVTSSTRMPSQPAGP